MKIRWNRFNIYLLIFLAAAFACSCKSPEKKREKAESTIRFHQEVPPDSSGRSERVPVYREKPVMINVEKANFLDESFVKEAKVVEEPGGFAISVQLDRKGSWLLENYTSANRNKRIAIFSEFANPEYVKPADKSQSSTNQVTENIARWLAAPRIPKPITDGRLVFTPDASRPEAEQIVRGLNNVAKRLDTGKEPF